MQLQERLALLDQRHQQVLRWFLDHTGTEVPWPAPLTDGSFLATQAKGIYKPAWMQYALSVRQTQDGPYPDRQPVMRADGSWTYLYYQEGEGSEDLERLFTNRALLQNLQDAVPVAVLRQTQRKPQARYYVLGLALVEDYSDGYFRLEGFASDGSHKPTSPEGPARGELRDALEQAEQERAFDPASVTDARSRALSAIVRRRGQRTFRRRLLQAYGGQCAITGSNVEAVLEAAHITPYMGPDTNTPQNGLLLRADIHTLWDLGLIVIDENRLTVHVMRALEGTSYEELAGQLVRLPINSAMRPSNQALRAHRDWAEGRHAEM